MGSINLWSLTAWNHISNGAGQPREKFDDLVDILHEAEIYFHNNQLDNPFTLPIVIEMCYCLLPYSLQRKWEVSMNTKKVEFTSQDKVLRVRVRVRQ